MVALPAFNLSLVPLHFNHHLVDSFGHLKQMYLANGEVMPMLFRN